MKELLLYGLLQTDGSGKKKDNRIQESVTDIKDVWLPGPSTLPACIYILILCILVLFRSRLLLTIEDSGAVRLGVIMLLANSQCLLYGEVNFFTAVN